MGTASPRGERYRSVNKSAVRKTSSVKAPEVSGSPTWRSLLSDTRIALAANLTAALDVAGAKKKEDDDYPVRKMKKSTLREETKIARSTITKIAAGKSSKSKGTPVFANPDLDTICRLAWALKLPPAFLLMTKTDWVRLTSSINTMVQSKRERPDIGNLKGVERAREGLRVAKELSMWPDIMKEAGLERPPVHVKDIKADIEQRNEHKRIAILTTTYLAQREAVTSDQRELLTAFGAFYGANTQCR